MDPLMNDELNILRFSFVFLELEKLCVSYATSRLFNSDLSHGDPHNLTANNKISR